jgi:hypothetical protein
MLSIGIHIKSPIHKESVKYLEQVKSVEVQVLASRKLKRKGVSLKFERHCFWGIEFT